MRGMTTDTDTRSRILDAAERAFAERGLAGARVASIAEEAGVNKAMLYYYFDNKEALYFALLERVMDQIGAVAAAMGLPSDAPMAERIREFVTGYQSVLARHPHFARLMMRGLLDHPDELLAFLRPRLAPVIATVMGRIAEAQQRGEINPRANPVLTPPTLVAPMVFFAFAEPLLTRVTGLPHEGLEAAWRENLLEIHLHGLLTREDP